MNNCVYGKTTENNRKKVDVQLVKDERIRQRLINQPTCQGFKIFDQTLTAIHMMKSHVYAGKPVFVGQVVLDISKTLMYDFHYNTIKKEYGDRARLLFTDTDSLCYSIETQYLYQDIGNSNELYDTSNYPVEHPIYSNAN
jgi:hypothetical protein